MPQACRRTGDFPLRPTWLPLLGLLGLLALLTLAWWLAIALTATPSNHPPSQQASSEGVQVFQGQLMAEMPERAERWTLQFREGHYDPEKQSAVTKDSVCQVTRKGRVVTIFAAPTIVVRFREQRMAMRGGVTVIGKLARLRVRLPSLTWDWRQGRLQGLGPVQIEGEGVRGRADGLDGDTTLQQLRLHRPQLNWLQRPIPQSSEGERTP